MRSCCTCLFAPALIAIGLALVVYAAEVPPAEIAADKVGPALRQARDQSTDALKVWVQLVGWPLGLACAVGGVGLAGKASAFAVELIGVVVAAASGILLVALVRCRRFEIVLGARLLTVGAGPLLRRVPVGLIERLEESSASSWRRLYSGREVVAHLTVGDRVLVFPSHDPQELLSAIAALQPG